MMIMVEVEGSLPQDCSCSKNANTPRSCRQLLHAQQREAMANFWASVSEHGHHIATKCKGDSHCALCHTSADLLWRTCNTAHKTLESIHIPVTLSLYGPLQ